MDSSQSNKKRTARWFQRQKGKQKLVCVTAYDTPSAILANRAKVDLVLIGDSMGNVLLGFQDTLAVSLAMMEHHVATVSRAKGNAMVVGDMPFGTYGSSVQQAVDSAVRIVKAGAEAVKLEGDFPEAIQAIIKVGIPVMGHLGLTPQSVNILGYRAQGKTSEEEQRIADSLGSIEEAGVFATVLEVVPSETAKRLTAQAQCPTIGIGSGPHCDGQIQVWHDILGLGDEVPRHAKQFVQVGKEIERALIEYGSQVRGGQFPTDQQSI